jgi:hypothetical protein
MKKLAILLIGITMLFASCKKDNDKPFINVFPTGNDWTVGRILDSLSALNSYQFDTVFDRNAQNAVVKGYVIADETNGNIYRTFYLRGEDGKCVAVYRRGASDGGSDQFNVRQGDYIGCKLYGSVVSSYNNLPQLQLQEHDVNSLIVIYQRDCVDKVQPVSTTIERIQAGEHLCDLVKLDDVQFESYSGLTYSEVGSNTNRTLQSCSGESIIVRTNSYANFAAEELPEGRGSLVSIASVFGTTWQLLLRNPRLDVSMTDARCGAGGDLMDLPYVQNFASSFGSYTTYNELGNQEWIIDFQTAKMTGKEGDNYYANEDWLISSPINMTGDNVIAEIQYIARYFSNFDNELTLWVSEDYIYDEYPYDFTWEQVPVEWQNSADWNTFNLKEVVLDDYIGKTVTFAVKYVSVEGTCGTIEIKSIAIKNGTPTPPPVTIFGETFAQGQGAFTIENVAMDPALNYVWRHDQQYSCMKASAYLNGSNHTSQSWLISPAIDLSEYDAATLTFEHTYRYGVIPTEEMRVYVSTDYVTGSPTEATWTKLDIPVYPSGSSWTFVNAGNIDLSAFCGNSDVHIAFRYHSTTESSATWEVKDVVVFQE